MAVLVARESSARPSAVIAPALLRLLSHNLLFVLLRPVVIVLVITTKYFKLLSQQALPRASSTCGTLIQKLNLFGTPAIVVAGWTAENFACRKLTNYMYEFLLRASLTYQN